MYSLSLLLNIFFLIHLIPFLLDFIFHQKVQHFHSFLLSASQYTGNITKYNVLYYTVTPSSSCCIPSDCILTLSKARWIWVILSTFWRENKSIERERERERESESELIREREKKRMKESNENKHFLILKFLLAKTKILN